MQNRLYLHASVLCDEITVCHKVMQSDLYSSSESLMTVSIMQVTTSTCGSLLFSFAVIFIVSHLTKNGGTFLRRLNRFHCFSFCFMIVFIERQGGHAMSKRIVFHYGDSKITMGNIMNT